MVKYGSESSMLHFALYHTRTPKGPCRALPQPVCFDFRWAKRVFFLIWGCPNMELMSLGRFKSMLRHILYQGHKRALWGPNQTCIFDVGVGQIQDFRVWWGQTRVFWFWGDPNMEFVSSTKFKVHFALYPTRIPERPYRALPQHILLILG